MEWVFLGLGIFLILLFLNLGFYFLCHQGKDPSIQQINRMDTGIQQIGTDMANLTNELHETNRLLSEVVKRLDKI